MYNAVFTDGWQMNNAFWTAQGMSSLNVQEISISPMFPSSVKELRNIRL